MNRTAGRRAGWVEHGERSNLAALRLMAWIAVALGRPVARLLLHPITLYYLCTAACVRRHSADYLTRVLGRPPTWRERYRHLHDFAATVLDRVYFVRSELASFEIDAEGHDMVVAAAAGGPGVVMLGAHIGSFEALHAVGRDKARLRVAMAMYPDNARMIHATLQAIAPGFDVGVIAIGRPGSTLAIRDWLDAGGLVGMLGDRYLGGAAGGGAGGRGNGNGNGNGSGSGNGNGNGNSSRNGNGNGSGSGSGSGSSSSGNGSANGSRSASASGANSSGGTSRGRSAAGSIEIDFLGTPARFSDGPLRLAQLLRRRVVFMCGIYLGANRYRVRFTPLADFTQPAADAADADRRVRQALHAYAEQLEALVRAHPFNWFNFYDFWE